MRQKSEASIISSYLLGESISSTFEERYQQAVLNIGIEMNEEEERLWGWMMNYPMMISFIDAVLGIYRPQGAIRQRIFIMLSILEASKEYSHYFLPIGFSRWKLVKLLFIGPWALLKIFIGAFLLLII